MPLADPIAPPAGPWPAADLEPVPACPVCGGADRASLHEGLTDRVFGAAPGRWHLVRCRGCGSAYLDARPTPASIGRAYATYYTHGDAPAGPPDPRLARLRRGLANDHLAARWGYRVAPRVRGGRLLARIAPLRAASADREVRHLPAVPGGRLLDVGAGSGAVVGSLAALGWRTEGLDPDPAAVAAGRAAGATMIEGTLATLDGPEHAGAYDAVTLSHVIEHLHDPVAELRRVHRLLRPGGLVWLATPNLESLGHRRFGRDWLGLDAPRHLVLFTPASLERALRTAGFVPEPTPTPAPIAFLSFVQSAALRDGRAPDAGPLGGRGRLRALAAVADRLAAHDPRHADELVAIARRG